MGTKGDDVLHGTPGDDVIESRGGNDIIYGYDGNDIICSGPGNDLAEGGNGSDLLMGSEGDDHLDGGAGNDIILGGVGFNTLYGGDGNDSITGGVDPESYYGGEGDDLIMAIDGDDIIYGEGGGDYLYGLEGNDFIDGGDGNDHIWGKDGDDTLIGGDGSDLFDGGKGPRDTLVMGTIDRDADTRIPIISPVDGRHAETGLPTADVTNQAGFCTLEAVESPEARGYQFLVRFFSKANGNLLVTIRLRDVEHEPPRDQAVAVEHHPRPDLRRVVLHLEGRTDGLGYRVVRYLRLRQRLSLVRARPGRQADSVHALGEDSDAHALAGPCRGWRGQSPNRTR